MRRFAMALLTIFGVAACSHPDSYLVTSSTLGPLGSGPGLQLTYNIDQDYWPMWTQDGRGILYSFVDAEGAIPLNHRCLGLLPAAGGTRIWQLCDNRAIRADSVSSYSAFSLDSTGRLLLVEATSGVGFASSFPFHIRMLLTDTAAPYVQSTLLTLPVTVGNVAVTWLSDVRWTGPNTFVALGQQFNSVPHCFMCACDPCPTDSTFGANGVVLVGLISAGRATLSGVDGTRGATGYALTNDGSIVFVRSFDGRLLRVSSSGGDAVTVATVTIDTLRRALLGVTCRGDHCLVADAPVSAGGGISSITGPSAFLARVSLTTGAVEQVAVYTGTIVATPQVSPLSGDVVVERGVVIGPLSTSPAPVLGHLTTFAGGNSDLYLYKGLLP